MKALVLTPTESAPSKSAGAVRDRPLPILQPGEVLIRVHAVAVNPVDQIYFSDPIAENERILGVDFAGTVVGRHHNLEGSSDCRTLDAARVAGFVQGGVHDVSITSAVPSY
jgi:NADPH:quinone reductase-like Zn-dependent oxidoreductase